MIKLYVVIFTLFVVIFTPLQIDAPVLPYQIIRVRILAYSPKQPREGHKNALNQCARNEKGISCHKSFLPLGSIIELPDGNKRVIDDRTPTKAIKIIGTKRVIETRWYESIKAKPKTKAVNRELRKRFDGGWDYIKVWEKK